MPDSVQPAVPTARAAPAALPFTPARVVVLGIGNSLLSDDGVGVHAIRCLRECAPDASIEWLDAGTLNFTLLHYLERAGALVVIDAAQLGEPPGTVRVYQGAEMYEKVGAGRHNSVHQAGLADLLAMARLRDCLPAHRALVTVQPGRIDWGESLSPAVAAALPAICEQARLLAQRWAE